MEIARYKGEDTDVRIPRLINGDRVVKIAGGAFMKKGLTSVTIPNTVTLIWSDAFRENKLTENLRGLAYIF